jgi:type IV secretory pathway VirB10-like protein
MFSRPLAFLLLALATITAAAGGAYVASRHNVSDAPAAVPAAPAPTSAAAQPTASQPVAETEAAVSSAKAAPAAAPAEAPAPETHHAEPAVTKKSSTPARSSSASNAPRNNAPAPARRTAPAAGAPTAQPALPPVAAPPPAAEPAKPFEPQPEPRHEPQFEEVILPSASVIGLQLDTPLSSERSHVEDRVDAHVTRDVMAAGRVAIPSGSKVVGSVVSVDRGGKVKQPARLAIRFHTLILADGSEVQLKTEPIDRTAESPANSSTKKIGGAAVAGTIIGAIIGGGKGAAIGGATGAAGGTAAVMAGDRSTVTVPTGALLNARLSSPTTITVERREQQD